MPIVLTAYILCQDGNVVVHDLLTLTKTKIAQQVDTCSGTDKIHQIGN